MVLIWVYLFPLCVLAKSEQTWHTKLQAATGQTWHKHLFKYSQASDKNNHLVAQLPTDLCFFPSISYSSPQFAVPCRPEWTCSCFDCDPWAFWAVPLPTGALCQSSGWATVAWACVQPKISSLYGMATVLEHDARTHYFLNSHWICKYYSCWYISVLRGKRMIQNKSNTLKVLWVHVS